MAEKKKKKPVPSRCDPSDLSLTDLIRTATDDASYKTEKKIEHERNLDELIRSALQETDDDSLMEPQQREPVYHRYIEVNPEEYEDERPKQRILFGISALLTLLVCAAAAFLIAPALLPDGHSDSSAAPAPVITQDSTVEETEVPEASEAPEAEENALKKQIEEIIQNETGIWSVYVKDLSSSDTFVINDVQMSAASLIKLFTAGRYFEAVMNGEIEETWQSAYDLQAMLSWSDNDAWYNLETWIGSGDYETGLLSVTDFARRHGFVNSGRDIGTESIYDDDADNLTTAAETGRVMEEIYRGTYVSKEASERIYQLLKEQQITYKIGSGLPEGFSFASKSGELAGIENDAAIVSGPDTDFVLCVLCNDTDDDEHAAEIICRIAEICAVSLNPSVSRQ